MRQSSSSPGTGVAQPAGPLDPFLASYAECIRGMGFQASPQKHQLWHVRRLSQWMDKRRIAVESLSEEVFVTYLAGLRRAGYVKDGRAATLRRFLAHLRQIGIVGPAQPSRDDSPIGVIQLRYETYLTVERGLSARSLINYVPFVRRFLVERFGSGPVCLMDIAARDVSQFVLRHASKMARRRASVMTTALRSFFRFLLQAGAIERDLAACVPRLANWRLATLPKYIAAEDVQRVIDACDRRTGTGHRDRAILLLLARLGLRAGEVTRLDLDDIDWRAGEIQIRGKTTTHDRFPLSQEVGEAIATYVRCDRPTCSTRSVFVRVPAPRRGLTVSMVSTIVKQALKRSGVRSPTWGSHLLRHSLATTLLGSGATLAQIGDVLRHRSVQTTEIYAKVDLQGLRSIARCWIEAGPRQHKETAMGYPDVHPESLRSIASPWPAKRTTP